MSSFSPRLGLMMQQLLRGEFRASWNTGKKGCMAVEATKWRKVAFGFVLLGISYVILHRKGMGKGPRSKLEVNYHMKSFTAGNARSERRIIAEPATGAGPPIEHAIENFSLNSSGPSDVAEGAYLFQNVCMTFNTHNTLERTERGLIWFDGEYNHAKRCVPCSNPQISFKWDDPVYRDYWGTLPRHWVQEGGLLRNVRTGNPGCGMMWVHKIVVHDVEDYNSCMYRHRIEIKERGQVQRPTKASRVLFHPGTTLALNWYHRNIGHQLFDSLTSLMPLLHSLFEEGEADLPYQKVIAHQLPKCDDSFYICNVLRRLGAFKDKEFIENIDDETMHCFEKIIVPRSGYFGRSHGKRRIHGFNDFREALFRAYGLPSKEALGIPLDKPNLARKPRVVFYRHASTARRVWLETDIMLKAFSTVFDVTDVEDFGKLSLKEQAEHFHRADLMLMAHGAQFANIIFCSSKSVVYEISCNGYSHVAITLPPRNFHIIHHAMKVPQRYCHLNIPDVLDANFTLPAPVILQRLQKDGVLGSTGMKKILAEYSRLKDEGSKNSKPIVIKPRKPAGETNSPDNPEYERERWHGRFDMRGVAHSNATCAQLPKVIPRYRVYRQIAKMVRDWPEAEMGKPRILCWAFTRTGFEKRAYALQETWGSKCDKLVFVSNAVIPNLKTLIIKLDDDSHDNLWTKLKISIEAIYKTYGKDFDWFYKIDDDTFALMGNLRKLLLSKKVRDLQEKGKGAYIGRHMDSRAYLHHRGGCRFNVGGSGYLFDNVAMQALSEKVKYCYPGKKSSADDMLIGCCVESQLGLLPLDTRDAAGGERFHPFDPQFCADYHLPKDKEKAMREDWFYSYSLKPLKEGLEHCAKDTVAWHHLPPHFVYQLYKLWYDCPQLLAN